MDKDILATPAASRRDFLKTAAKTAAVAGAGITVGASTFPLAAHAATDDPATILGVALVAEYLAVTFQTTALNNAAAIGLRPDEVTTIQGIAGAEAIHVRALGGDPTVTPPFTGGFGAVAAGSVPIYSGPFAFPAGTFTSRAGYATTAIILETAFVAAYMAATREFAADGRADLAQLTFQVGAVEAEHRALARAILMAPPYANLAFERNLIPNVAAAATVLTNLGFLSPTAGNSYPYTAAAQTQALSYVPLLSQTQI